MGGRGTAGFTRAFSVGKIGLISWRAQYKLW